MANQTSRAVLGAESASRWTRTVDADGVVRETIVSYDGKAPDEQALLTDDEGKKIVRTVKHEDPAALAAFTVAPSRGFLDGVSRPLYEGSPVKVWHAGLGAAILGAALAYLATRT